MKLTENRCRIISFAVCLLLACAGVGDLHADDVLGDGDSDQPRVQRVYKLSPVEYLKPDELEHPLVPALQLAYEGMQYMHEKVSDYSCRLVARERINGTLRDYQYMDVKVRHEQRSGEAVVPFSVYLRFRSPAALQGREVLYVTGVNDGKLLARNGGTGNLQDVTMLVDPLSPRAMRDRRNPLTDIGIQRLAERLIEIGRESLRADVRRECEVIIRSGAKIEGRPCRVIQVRFPNRRDNIRFHLARIFVDEKIPVPVRYESYSWPRQSGEPPLLMDEFTYLNLKLNAGLQNRDFDRNNPQYGFYESRDSERTDASPALRDTQSATVSTGQ